MTLGELIAALEKEDPTLVVPHGFLRPHSYRGFYHHLAFEPEENVSIGDMLAAARGALGETFQGWKGGDYQMDEGAPVWIAVEGDANGDTIGKILLSYMINLAKRLRDEQRAKGMPNE